MLGPLLEKSTMSFALDVVFPNLTVEPRPVNSQKIRGGLLVSPGSLERSFDYESLDVFERHVWRNIPGDVR